MLKVLVNHWYGLSIKSKFLLFIIFTILCVSLLSFFTQRYAFGFMDEFNNTLTSYYRINKLLVEVQENRRNIEKYLKDMRKEDLDRFAQVKKSLMETLDMVDKESNHSLETYFLIRAVRNALDVYFEKCDSALEVRRKSSENYYIHFYEANHISQYIEDYISQLLYVRLREGSWFYNQLVGKANGMKVTTFVAIVIMSIISIVFGLVFSNHITRPIRKLAISSTKMSKGDLDVKQIQVKSNDEVGVLAEAFNHMIGNIREMVNDLKEKSELERKLHEEELKNIKIQQLLKEAEFLGLQSQINPHFLFNTLNVISRISMFEKADNTTRLIQSLSNLFRYNLGSESKTLTLAKEIEITKEYMMIQQFRFGERLRFDVRCRTNVENVMIPRFTLQPLIENAIIHGIEPKERGGTVRIKIQEQDGSVLIKVIDGGTGITKERLNAILNTDSKEHKGHTTGIGLANVMSRLKLYFNDENCFNIRSKPGLGTVIRISIPMKRGEESVVQAADCG